MRQIPSDELALSPAWLPLVVELAQSADLDELERRCAAALGQIMPAAEVALRWCEGADPLGEAEMASLCAGEGVPGGLEQPGYLPIRAGGALIGYFSISPGVWSGEQEQALALLAAIAGPARLALAPLTPPAELALRQNVAAELGVIRQLIQLEELIERACAAAELVCAPCSVGVALRYRRSEWLELASVFEAGERQRPRSFWSRSAGLSSVIMASGAPLLADDYFAECARRGLQPIAHSQPAEPGAWMGTPLRAGPEILGTLNVLLHGSGRTFSPLERELLMTIAAEAGGPLHNALRYRQAEQQARQLTALNQIVRTMNSTLDPERVPALIIEQAQELLEAEEGTLLLLDEQTGELVFSYASGPAGQRLLGQRLPPGKGIAGYVASSGQSTIVNDARSDGRFYSGADGGTGFTTRSLVAVPLRGIDGVKGVIEVVNRRDNAPFTEEDSALAEAVADQAMIALENARRFARIDQALARRAQELNRSNDQLRKILRVSHLLRAERRLDDLLRQIADAVVESAGFRSAVIALVQRERTPEPYLRRIVAAGPAAASLDRVRGARAPLVGLQAILRPEYRRGSLTYLIDHSRNDYVDLWGGTELVYAPQGLGEERPGGWRPGDVLFSLLRDSRGELLGTLRVDDPEDGLQPTHEQVQILEIFANQAAVAIESARLYNEQQHSLQSMMALNGLGMAINTTLRSPDQIYQLTARGMVEMTEASWATVFLSGSEGEDLRAAFQTGPAPGAEAEQLSREAIGGRRPVTALAAGPEGEARIAIPLRATRRVLGAICVGYAEGLPLQSDLETLNLFANQAAVAVESAELLDAVRLGRDRLATIMASTHEGLLLLDRTGAVAVANDAFHALADAALWPSAAPTPEDLAGMRMGALIERWQSAAAFPTAEIAQLGSGLAAVADGLEAYAAGELNARGPGARALSWTALRAAGEGPAEDRPAGERWPALLTLRDVSAEKETERLRQDLTSMIVHDLRSPLTSIMTSIDMFFRGITGEVTSVQREILTIAYASTQHLLNMVNLLLDISRLEGGRMPLDRTPIAARGLVERAITRMAIIAQNGGLSVEHRLDHPEQLIYADGELVLRVLQNLLDNALKFSPKGASVELRVSTYPPEAAPNPQVVAASGQTSISVDSQRMVLFAVRDQGVGIRASDLEKIFQKFGQAGDKRNSGSGLGLTFCKLVVEAHGGQIWVESAPGAGSTFYFTLPAASMQIG